MEQAVSTAKKLGKRLVSGRGRLVLSESGIEHRLNLEKVTGVIRSRYHPAMMCIRRSSPQLAVLALTMALTVMTTHQSLRRYEDFRSGFSWDLAYYNQWFWAMTRGDGLLTVRPLSAYAEE